MWRHTKSALPSPSRSPIPTICQANGTPGATTGACFTIAPFISHTATSPVCIPRQTRSALPSPSRSPKPTTCHARGTLDATSRYCFTVRPLISHAQSPPVPSRQTKSVWPSPSRSPTPAICQLNGMPGATTGACFTVTLSISHIATSPTGTCCRHRSRQALREHGCRTRHVGRQPGIQSPRSRLLRTASCRTACRRPPA